MFTLIIFIFYGFIPRTTRSQVDVDTSLSFFYRINYSIVICICQQLLSCFFRIFKFINYFIEEKTGIDLEELLNGPSPFAEDEQKAISLLQ